MHFRIKRISSLISVFLISLVITSCESGPTEPDGPGTGNLFVLNALEQSGVSLVDIETGSSKTPFVNTRDVPSEIDIQGTTLFVLNAIPASLDIFNTTDGSSVKTVNLTGGSNPYDILYEGDRLLVTGLLSDQLYVLDAEGYAVQDSVAVGPAPEGLTMDADNIYVACTGGWMNNYQESSVQVIRRSDLTVIDTIATDTNPQRFAWSSDGLLHVLCTGNYSDTDGVVNVIDPTAGEVVATIPTGGFPGNITITRDDIGYLSDFGVSTGQDSTGFLYSYDAASYQVRHDSDDPILVGFGAMGMDYDRENHKIFIANFGIDTVQEFNPDDNSVIETYPVGDGPQSVIKVD